MRARGGPAPLHQRLYWYGGRIGRTRGGDGCYGVGAEVNKQPSRKLSVDYLRARQSRNPEKKRNLIVIA
jgi:hypothetical protein